MCAQPRSDSAKARHAAKPLTPTQSTVLDAERFITKFEIPNRIVIVRSYEKYSVIGLIKLDMPHFFTDISICAKSGSKLTPLNAQACSTLEIAEKFVMDELNKEYHQLYLKVYEVPALENVL